MTVATLAGNVCVARMAAIAVWSVVCVCVVFVICLGPSYEVHAAEVREQRYLFDETFHWMTTEQREKLLTDLMAAGFNTIVPVIWRGKGVSWPSALAPMDPAWSGTVGASVDPLRELITQAHAMGIKVIPWFTVAHRRRDFFPEFHDTGTPEHAFNVHDEGFRKFIVQLMMEVVDRYDVDGINLDYVRSKGVCKTSACRMHYGDHMRRDLLQDAERMWTNKESGDSLAKWNADAVTRIIEEFSAQAKARRPNLPISIDSHPVAKWTHLEGASSIAWANRGLIDLIFDMQYKKEIDRAAVSDAKAKLRDPAKYVLLVGNYEVDPNDKQRVWPRDAVLVADLLKQSQFYSREAHAAALYEYPFLNGQQILSISRGPFKPGPATGQPRP